MKMKQMLALGATAMMAISLAACGSSSSNPAGSSSAPASTASSTAVSAGKAENHTVEAIKAKGKLVVTTEATYPPFEFQTPDGELAGLDISLAKALAEELGVELEMQNITFEMVVSEVQAGNADLAIAGLSPTAERKESVDMSDVYYGGIQVILVREEDYEKFSTADSLANATIATQKGAIQQTLMEEQFPEAESLLLPKFPQCIQELKLGNCDAVMIDEASANNYMKSVEGLVVAQVPVETDPTENGNAVAVMKGNTDLMDWVNAKIAEYTENGKIQEWYDAATEAAEAAGVM